MGKLLIYLLQLCILIICITSCTNIECGEEDICGINSSSSGRINQLIINEGRNYKVFNYKFNYNGTTGKIERISNDSVDVCTFIEIDRDSLLVEWRSRRNNNINNIWSISLDEHNMLERIYSINPTNNLAFPYFRVSYDNDGLADTIYEPNVLSLSSKDHSFVFVEENCQSYVYQYTGDFQNGSDEIAMTYTSYLNNFQIPRQRPYNSFATIFTLESYLDPLYLLGLWGVEVLPLNRNLIHMKDDMRYSYEFDICNRVKYMVITTEGVEDTLVTMRMTYY